MLTKFKTLSKNLEETRRNLTMCERCYSFYYKKSWHLKRPEYLNEYHDGEVPVLFTECSACLEEENAFYEKESNLSSGMV